jgi:hypothetical protein
MTTDETRATDEATAMSDRIDRRSPPHRLFGYVVALVTDLRRK